MFECCNNCESIHLDSIISKEDRLEWCLELLEPLTSDPHIKKIYKQIQEIGETNGNNRR